MRLRWTHDATVFGERKVGENATGVAQTVTDTPILEFPCRLHSSREEIDYDETGSRIEREPFAVCPVHGYDADNPDAMLRVPEVVETDMDIGLTDRMLTDATERLQVLSIDMERGRGNAPATVVLGLERLPDESGDL